MVKAIRRLVILVEDIPKLMMIYGIGYILIYLLFSLMYMHALKKKTELQLTVGEIFETKTKLFKNIILIAIGLLSVFVSQTLPANDAGISRFGVHIDRACIFNIFWIQEQGEKVN